MKIREVILDTETTGLTPEDGHKLIEIGALEMINKVITGKKFHCYLNPERDVSPSAYRVHGISTNFLIGKPLFREIARDFLNFIGNSPLVIHNAKFDMKFINHELKNINLPLIEFEKVIDTLVVARKKFPGSRVNLDALCKRFKVDNSSRKFHGALKDAELLAKVYVELSGGRQGAFSIISAENVIYEDDLELLEVNDIVIAPTEDEIKMHEVLLNLIDQYSMKR